MKVFVFKKKLKKPANYSKRSTFADFIYKQDIKLTKVFRKEYLPGIRHISSFPISAADTGQSQIPDLYKSMSYIPRTKKMKCRDIEVFTTLTSGHFSNAKSLSELRQDGITTAQNVIDMYCFPINYPALESEIVIFFNELKDGKVTRQQYVALNQLGPVIHMQQYNVVKSKLFNQALVNISEIESLSRDDLGIAPNCQSFATRIGETLFTTEYPNCNVDGFNSETYKTTHTCTTLTFYVDSREYPESKSKLPYMLNKEESYPVPASIFPDYDKYKDMCKY